VIRPQQATIALVVLTYCDRFDLAMPAINRLIEHARRRGQRVAQDWLGAGRAGGPGVAAPHHDQHRALPRRTEEPDAFAGLSGHLDAPLQRTGATRPCAVQHPRDSEGRSPAGRPRKPCNSPATQPAGSGSAPTAPTSLQSAQRKAIGIRVQMLVDERKQVRAPLLDSVIRHGSVQDVWGWRTRPSGFPLP